MESLQAKALGQTHGDVKTNPSAALVCSLSRGEQHGEKGPEGAVSSAPAVGRRLQCVFEARAEDVQPLWTQPEVLHHPCSQEGLIFANCHPLCVLLAHRICLPGMK